MKVIALNFTITIQNSLLNAPELGRTLVGAAKQSPKWLGEYVKDPVNISLDIGNKVWNILKSEGSRLLKTLQVEPGLVIGELAGEYVLFAGASKALKVVGRIVGKGTMRLPRLFKKINKIKVNIKGIPKGTSKVGISSLSNKVKLKLGIGKTTEKIISGSDDFAKVVDKVDDVTDNVAKARARQIADEFVKRGGKFGVGQEEELIQAIRRVIRKNLENLPDYQRLVQLARLNKPSLIKISRTRKLISPSKILEKITKKIKSLSTIKKINANKFVRNWKKRVSKVSIAKKEAIKKFKSSVEFKTELKKAKATRKRLMKRGGTVNIGTTSYTEALDLVEDVLSTRTRKIAKAYVKKLKKDKLKIVGGEREFIKAVEDRMQSLLKSTKEYKALLETAKLNKPFQLKLIRAKKISTAKIIFNKLKKIFNNNYIVKKIREFYNKNKGIRKIRETAKSAKKSFRKARVKSKSAQSGAIKDFKSAVELKKELAKVKRRRLANKGRAKRITIGNNDYVEAIDKLYDFADDLAELRVRAIVKKMKLANRPVTAQMLRDIRAVAKKQAKETLESFGGFKKLKTAAKMNKPFQIKMRKLGKIETAKRFFNQVKTRIIKSPISVKVRGSRFVVRGRKVIRKTKVIGRKIKKGPKRIAKKVKASRVKRKRIAEYKKSYKYRLQQMDVKKSVSLDKLNRVRRVGDMNNFIDKLFNELWDRRKISTTAANFRQLKNITKKKARKIINSGNKAELNKLKATFKRVIDDLNSPNKKPTIKVIEKGKTGAKIKVIKNFDPKVGKGSYGVVENGGKVKQVLVTKTKKVKVPTATTKTFIVRAVEKPLINLGGLVRFVTFTTARNAFANINKTKSGFSTSPRSKQRLLLKTRQKQDSAFVQKFQPILKSSTKTTQDIIQAQDFVQKSRTKQKTKQKQIQKTKKKKVFIPRIKGEKSRRISDSKTGNYYIVEKRRGKLVRLRQTAAPINEARDYLAYKVDNNLSRTAYLIPAGPKAKVSKVPKNIKGYYSKVSRKLRPYKIRYGKKKQLLNGFIEKNKYISDTRQEKAQLKTLRKKAPKRKITAAQRKVLIQRLKKARAAKKNKTKRRK